jgi:hypothetical protein
VLNTCHKGGPTGPVKVIEGKAKIADAATKAKLKVSFFGPFFVGDYWVLDHADDYSWSIVGEGSGRYLWLLTRKPPTPGRAQGADGSRQGHGLRHLDVAGDEARGALGAPAFFQGHGDPLQRLVHPFRLFKLRGHAVQLGGHRRCRLAHPLHEENPHADQ